MSIIYYVYQKRRGYKKSGSIDVLSNDVFGGADFVINIFTNHGQKKHFSASSQIPISEKSFLGQFEVVFLSL